MLARAIYENIMTRVAIFDGSDTTSARERKSIVQDTVAFYEMMKGVLSDQNKTNVQDFYRAFEYMGPRMLFLYQTVGEQGLREDATDLEKMAIKLEVVLKKWTKK